MSNNQIAIVGLGPLSASIGLALRKARQDLLVVGTDRDQALATRMQKLGAVDRVERNPASACQDAGLIIIAEPLSDMATIFQNIAGVVPSGSVITDTAPLKTDVLRWAQERLPEHTFFVGGHPLVMAPLADEQPRADLFTNTQYCLVPAANANQAVVEVVEGLVGLLGAQPYFLDAAEHDGLMAAVEQLPHVLQLALLAALSQAGSWRDNQRAASRPFVDATAALADSPELDIYTQRLNRENLVRWIGIFQEALAHIKLALLAEEEEAFKKLVTDLYETHQRWMHDRQVRAWESPVPQVKVDKGSIWRRLLLPEIRRKP